jgi:Tfp pilus assembly protein PilF
LALHRQGKLAEAEHLYQEVLRQDPSHSDALHLSGVIALQSSRVDRGLELIRRAIRLNPNNAAAHNNIGFALQALKRLPEALASHDRGDRPQAGLCRCAQQPRLRAPETQAPR